MSTRASFLGFGASVLLAGIGFGQVTQRVSVTWRGQQGNGGSNHAMVSPDGRYVAFQSWARNLVRNDANGIDDIFVRDRLAGTTERVSVASDGTESNGASYSPSISADGRFVAFGSDATNLVAGDTNESADIFVRDRLAGTTERVSVDSSGAEANGLSLFCSISADGRYVVFGSVASNLVATDTNGMPDVFVHDRQTGTTERVSVSSGGEEGNSVAGYGRISDDDRYVAFWSDASNLVPGDTNGFWDVFVRDLQTGTTERVSVDSLGQQGDEDSLNASISADGRFVVFESQADDLVAGDTNATWDVFVHDRSNGTTRRVSVDSAGTQAIGTSWGGWISADGRWVSFFSYSPDLVAGDTNGFPDIFVRDLQGGTTERVSLTASGGQTNGYSESPTISADGRFVAFLSAGSNLVAGDTNGQEDIFLRDRFAAGFASLCVPGVDGILACPCSNPPGGPGRGCDNSAATGGAVLSASGVAYLSMDSLVFTTGGEKPTALSVLAQGNAILGTGASFGQGVRCVQGAIKRLYTKSAVGGSITAPNLGAGDPKVSVRSAALGDAIAAGQSRWYFVYYRDPVVLGGCPSGSTFNATQTGLVSWSP